MPPPFLQISRTPSGQKRTAGLIAPLEAQRRRSLHARNPLDAGQYLGRDMAVDRDQRDRFAACLAPAEVEGRDIDPGLAERRAEPADEAGRALVDDIDHLADQLRLDPHPEQFDEAR